MSLEIALQENTATLKELIGALQSMGKLEIIPVTAAKKSAPVKVEAPAPTPAAEVAAPAAPEPVAESPSEAAPLNYDKDVKPLILRLASVDRQAVVDVLGRFGVTTAKDLKPEQYAQVIADVNNVIAGGAV